MQMLLYPNDIVLFYEDIQELNCTFKIYEETFSHCGLKIATDKTKTISFNLSEDVMNTKSLISLRDKEI